MGFPIKKRMSPVSNPMHGDQSSIPNGLDLLSAAIASRPQTVQSMPARTYSESTIVTTSTSAPQECPSSHATSDNEGDSSSNKEEVAKAMSSSYNSDQKRAKTFPEVLMEILSTPEYNSIMGWLPHGKSFAIHNPSQFSSVILPKYFRKVIFRSFIRKLNRWGFRSVKRSVSGFESTFEHKFFTRDAPELTTKMYCKSNPTSRAATRRNNSTGSETSEAAAVSPSNSADALSTLTAVMSSQQSLPQRAHPLMSSNVSLMQNEEFEIQLRNELILREYQQQRQNALMQMVHQMPMSESDLVSQYVAERWQRILMAQQQQQSNLSGL